MEFFDGHIIYFSWLKSSFGPEILSASVGPPSQKWSGKAWKTSLEAAGFPAGSQIRIDHRNLSVFFRQGKQKDSVRPSKKPFNMESFQFFEMFIAFLLGSYSRFVPLQICAFHGRCCIRTMTQQHSPGPTGMTSLKFSDETALEIPVGWLARGWTEVASKIAVVGTFHCLASEKLGEFCTAHSVQWCTMDRHVRCWNPSVPQKDDPWGRMTKSNSLSDHLI